MLLWLTSPHLAQLSSFPQSASPPPLRNATNAKSIKLFSGSPVHREKSIFSRFLQCGIMADHDGSKLKMSGVRRNQGKQISQQTNFSPFQPCKFVMLHIFYKRATKAENTKPQPVSTCCDPAKKMRHHMTQHYEILQIHQILQILEASTGDPRLT